MKDIIQTSVLVVLMTVVAFMVVEVRQLKSELSRLQIYAAFMDGNL